MKVVVIYGNQTDLMKLTKPVMNEIVIELGVVTPPVLVTMPILDALQLHGLKTAMLESETDLAIILTGDLHISAQYMQDLQKNFPFIDGFRAANAPFHSASFLNMPARQPDTVH